MRSLNPPASVDKPLVVSARLRGTSLGSRRSKSVMRALDAPTDLGPPLEATAPASTPAPAAGLGEAWLLRRLRRREPEAFREMVTRHQTPFYSLCLRMLGNPTEAEDVAQDVFVRCFVSIERFRGDSSLSTWLYRIAVNLCKNRLKHLSRRRWGLFDRFEELAERLLGERPGIGSSMGEALPPPDAALTGSQTEHLVQRALSTLEVEHRELLILRDIEGLSYADVQAVTGLAEGTVKSRLHRARLALKAAYERLLAEDGGTEDP